MAIILAVTKWKSYLQHQEFNIVTDHKSLIHLGEQKLQEGMQHKAFLKLLGLQYKILYKKRLENKVADALSRQTEPGTVAAISTNTPRWLEIIVEGYTKDDQTKQRSQNSALLGQMIKVFHYLMVSSSIKTEFG